MSKPTNKRLLKLSNLDSVIEEVETLRKGYTSRGNWTLGQTCGHLSDWMRYPMDGFPTPPIFLRPIFWIMKVTVGGRMKKKILAEGFKPGMPTAPDTVPDASENDDELINKYFETIERLKNHSGPLHPSPLFGPMDKETLIKVSVLHAEHHLAFLQPSD